MVPQTTVKRHEKKNKKQRSTNTQSCHVNTANGYSVTWFQACIRIHLQQPSSRWLKSTKYKKKRNPTMEFLLSNPLTCFRLQISPKTQSISSTLINILDFSTLTDVYSDKTNSICFILRKGEVSPSERNIKLTKQTNKKQ